MSFETHFWIIGMAFTLPRGPLCLDNISVLQSKNDNRKWLNLLPNYWNKELHIYVPQLKSSLWLMAGSIQQDDSETIFLALFSDAFQVFLQVEVAFYSGLCSAVDGSFVEMSVSSRLWRHGSFSPKASSIWNIISGSLVFNTFQKLAREQQWLG